MSLILYYRSLHHGIQELLIWLNRSVYRLLSLRAACVPDLTMFSTGLMDPEPKSRADEPEFLRNDVTLSPVLSMVSLILSDVSVTVDLTLLAALLMYSGTAFITLVMLSVTARADSVCPLGAA